MTASVTELREQARLLEVELTRQAAAADSTDTRAGVAVGFAGVLIGLLLQAKHPGTTFHVGVGLALGAAVVGLAATFPRRLRFPDPMVVSDLFTLLAEEEAIEALSRVRIRAIEQNCGMIELKRILLSIAVLMLVAGLVLSAIAVL